MHTNDRFKHLAEENLDIELGATEALGNEQRILILLEKMGFAIRMGNKVLSWFDDLEVKSATEEQQIRFKTAVKLFGTG